jgi:hypothetical protein
MTVEHVPLGAKVVPGRVPASGDVAIRARLGEVIGRLGLLPSGTIAGACDEIVSLTGGAFARPLTDVAYRDNALCPGAWPIEMSFAEDDAMAVRVDLAPLDPAAEAHDRLAAAMRLAQVAPGTVSPWRRLLKPERFGGFVGASITAAPSGPARVDRRAYLELDHGAALEDIPEPLGSLAADLARDVPGLEPHLVALPGGANGTPPRVYFECRTGLALLCLYVWSSRRGLDVVALGLIVADRQLVGGRLVLPEASVLVALRAGSSRAGSTVIELKLEVTRRALVDRASDIVSRLLVGRPEAGRSYERWRTAMAPVLDLTVVSVRIATGAAAPNLNTYAGLIHLSVDLNAVSPSNPSGAAGPLHD